MRWDLLQEDVLGIVHYEFWKGQKKIMILDNNILGLQEHFKGIASQLIDKDIITDFCQGLDIRLINEENADLLSQIKHWKQIHFAFDWIEMEPQVKQGIKLLKKAGIKPYKLMFYVLIGFNTTPEQDLYRIELLRSLGCDPYVCAYDKTKQYQRDFQRWVNHKAIFKSVKWEDYKNNKQEEARTQTSPLF